METKLLTIALAATTLLAMTTPVSADTNGCTVTTVGGTCTFHCHANDYVSVYVWGNLLQTVGGSAVCSNLNAHCSGVGLGANGDPGCSAEDGTASGDDSNGVCTLNHGTKASCTNTRLQAP